MSRYEPGQAIEGSVTVSREIALAYALASADDNPIHRCDDAARALGLPGAVAHGMWTYGAALTVLGERRVRATTGKFARPVLLPAQGEKVLRVTGQVTAAEGDEATVALQVLDGDERVARLEVRCER